jgi:hypothetical protein
MSDARESGRNQSQPQSPETPKTYPYEAHVNAILEKYPAQNLGKLTALLDYLPRPQADEIWHETEKIHSEFWAYWDPIRKEHYEATLLPYGPRKDIAGFVEPHTDDLIVDFAGGRAPEIPYLVTEMKKTTPKGRLAVLEIDQNPFAEVDAKHVLEQVSDNLSYGEYILGSYADLGKIIADRLPQIGKFKRLRGVFVWGHYSPNYVLAERLHGFFETGAQLGIPTDLNMVMLNPSFDPGILGKIFMEQLLPELVKTEEGRKIAMATKISLPFTQEHSREVVKNLPVYKPQDVEEYLRSTLGLKSTVSYDVLKGHSIFTRYVKN